MIEADALNALGMYLKYVGRFEEAQPLYDMALQIITQRLGSDHPDAAAILHNLAGLAHARGDYNAAEPLARRSLSILEANHGHEHLDVAADRAALAAIA